MKKGIAFFLILSLLLSFVSCGTAQKEEGAGTGEYIEGESQQMSGDAPQKGNTQGTIQYLDSSEIPQKTPQVDNDQEEEEQQEETPPEKEPEQPEEQPEEIPEEKPEEQQPQEQPEEPPVEEPVEEEPEEAPEEEEPEEEEETPSEDDVVSTPPVNSTPVVKPPAVDPKANDLKIVSYNVRCADDGKGKKISDRAPRFKTLMDQYDPDIMGLQEVVPKWMNYLEENLSEEYEYINKWRAANSKESTPIFWKKDKFICLESGYFWLSDTPDQESKAENWGAKHYRICMWVKLRVKATGKVFLFYNTHFDTKDGPKVPSAELIIRRISDQGGFIQYPVFCTGDFNMGPDSNGYKKMYDRFHDINRDLTNDQTPTFTKYDTLPGSIIDFCFYSSGLIQPLKYKVVKELVDGGFVSDHNGVYVEAKLL